MKRLEDLISRPEREKSDIPTLDAFLKRKEDIEMDVTNEVRARKNEDKKGTAEANALLKENEDLKKKVATLMEENDTLRDEMNKLKEDMRSMIQEEIQKALKIHEPIPTNKEAIKNEPKNDSWAKAVSNGDMKPPFS